MKCKKVSMSRTIQSRYVRLKTYHFDQPVAGFLFDFEIAAGSIVATVYDHAFTMDGSYIEPYPVFAMHKYECGLWCVETSHRDFFVIVSYASSGLDSLLFYVSLLDSCRLLTTPKAVH